MIAWKPKSADSTIASVRYRCLMPLSALQARRYPVEIFREDREQYYSSVIFSKLYDLKNIALARRLKQRGAQVVLDICDNHFYNPRALPDYQKVRKNLLQMLWLCDHVVCTTEALANEIQQEAPFIQRPTVIGDAIEHLPVNDALHNSTPGAVMQLLWFGSHGSPNADGGMLDILNIATPLTRLAERVPIELHVVSNNQQKYREHIEPLPFQTRYSEWSYESFDSELRQATAVLLPITENAFSRCKSNNRLVTALNYGKPVIADAIPSYYEFSDYVRFGDWSANLDALIDSPAREKERALAGMEYVSRHWNLATIADRWIEFMDENLRKKTAPTEAAL